MQNRTKFLIWLTALFITATAVPIAQAQDFPTLKGGNQRQGRNDAPAISGPGRAFLNWWRPSALDTGASGMVLETIVRNNTAIAPHVTRAGNWFDPLPMHEANFSFQPPSTGNAAYDQVTGSAAQLPGYSYAATIPSAEGPDPRVRQNQADVLSTFSWRIEPIDQTSLLPTNVPGSYAIYVWLPIGGTVDPNSGNTFFTQRFFVYEVSYAGRTWIEVLDTYATGPGWARIGNGGRPTNQLFQYDGVNPIVVTLYNTVPRDEFGRLTDTPYTTLVYADAAQGVPEIGHYRASPIVAMSAAGNIQAFGALNRVSLGMRAGQPITQSKGILSAYNYDFTINDPARLNTRWTFTPLDESEHAINMDNLAASVVAPFQPETFAANFRGTNYHAAVIGTNSLGAVTYDPGGPDGGAMEDGTYEVFAWLPGNSNGEQFGVATRYEIFEGGQMTVVNVDQSLNRGWVRIGTRRFTHQGSIGEKLRVAVVNRSSDPADAPRKAYADVIRFVGAANLNINSTPVHARARVRGPGGVMAERDVVIMAAENGRIYCLDADGNADGTTNVYWTYPSTPNTEVANWTDPNHTNEFDGDGPIAEMPAGFNLSSALVQRIDGEDYLYIGSTNGRIYCIAMDGRGDSDFGLRRPGTTRRVWTYPNDYPGARVPTALGPFTGSVAYAQTADGHTIFAPTEQGRMYALDALGNPPGPGSQIRQSAVRWTYPAATQQTLGAIRTTPSVEFGRVYFGTAIKDGEDRARFYALNMNTGAVVWSFEGTLAVPTASFLGGPATVPATELGGTMPNTIYVANQNRYVYALNADTGQLLWSTNELDAGANAPLTYTPLSVFDNSGTVTVPMPVILVPTADGRIAGLFARTTDLNRDGGRRAWEFRLASDSLIASVAVGRNWMYAADMAGYFYGFTDFAGGPGGQGSPPPGSGQTIVENDPTAEDELRQSKITLITRDMYRRLRLPEGDPLLPMRDEALAAQVPISQSAFEWGQTLHILVYDFKFERDANNRPPVVNFEFSMTGTRLRNLSVEARQFRSGSGTPPDRDGYAVMAFSIQGSGANALPPGDGGRISFTISSAAFNQDPNNTQPLIFSTRATPAFRDFSVANPLGVVMRATNGVPLDQHSIGWSTNASLPENMVNGSPNIPSNPLKNESLLTLSLGQVFHGQSRNSEMYFVDRSLMTLLRGPERGLDNVRVLRRDLEWSGGVSNSSPFKRLPPAFTNFEDLPVNFPNTSLDYPNMHRDVVRITKDLFGNAENPLFNPVSLIPPRNVDPDNPENRQLVLTPVDVAVDVPRYQPANLIQGLNSASQLVDAGYRGRFSVFVDSSGNGLLDLDNNRAEAFRSFWIGASVPVDERMFVGTPTVDLGSLAGGTGFSPTAPWANGSPFSPWTGPYSTLFQPFTVFNDGNVNMLNLRLAKATNQVGVGTRSWRLMSPANNELAWLDADWHLWSDIDPRFALTSQVILQKPRVGDRMATELTTNPIRRPNANLGVIGGPMLAEPTPAPPRVGVSVPIGQPVGSYVSLLRVIEDANNDQALQLNSAGVAQEVFTDPSLTLRFNVRETRLTNSFTPRTAPMVDNLVPDGFHADPANRPYAMHGNLQPAAFRDSSGNLVVAWTSNRPVFEAQQPGAANANPAWRIYVSSLNGSSPQVAQGQSPLRDLNAFEPDTRTRWFSHAAGPFPNLANIPADTLFNSQAGEAVIPETITFGGASFPAAGIANPLNPGSDHSFAYMGFVGDAQKQTGSGRIGESRIFLAPVTVARNGAVSIGNIVGMPHDPQVGKGRPAIVQIGNLANVFYAAGGTGQSQLFYTTYDPASGWSQPRNLDVGAGFEWVSAPSAYARQYRGANASQPVVDMAFAGKLRGRPHSDIFYGRVILNNNGRPSNQTHFLPERTDRLSAADQGVYRTPGVSWNRNGTIRLTQVMNGVETDLEVAGSRSVDRSTGIVSFRSHLGGQVYLDPALGTVRFSSATPAQAASLFLTYSPRFLRVSGAAITSSHTSPSFMFDDRHTDDVDYWGWPSGTAPSEPARVGRMVITFGRAAAGAGQSSRPFMRSIRFGISLPTPVHTQQNGTITNISVTGATNYFQVEPGTGRVYFTASDEDRQVTVTYTAANEQGQNIGSRTVNARVTVLAEQPEAPVPIEQVVNEAHMYTFLDPGYGAPQNQRPGMIWMFWTSTRGGSQDVYFQTVAPRFGPVAVGR